MKKSSLLFKRQAKREIELEIKSVRRNFDGAMSTQYAHPLAAIRSAWKSLRWFSFDMPSEGYFEPKRIGSQRYRMIAVEWSGWL